MPKYKKGDVVVITAKRHHGCVGRIDKVVSRKDLDKKEGSAYKIFIFDHSYSDNCSGQKSDIYWFEKDLRKHYISAQFPKADEYL